MSRTKGFHMLLISCGNILDVGVVVTSYCTSRVNHNREKLIDIWTLQ